MIINSIILILILICIIYMYISKNNCIYNNNNFTKYKNIDKKKYKYLLIIERNIITIINYMYNNRHTKFEDICDIIEQTFDKLDDLNIIDNMNNDKLTSYTINKKTFVFCIQSKTKDDMYYDVNLLMFVVLHEMAHFLCPYYDGHDDYFYKIFNILINVAVELGLYTKINFKKEPHEYCGLMINT